MKIVEVNTYTVRPRWGFVEIVTDEGLTGWGEPVLEGHCATVLACVQEMKPYLIGHDPSRIEDIWSTIYRAGFYRGGGVLMSAIAGIDQALWDIKGKATNLPVYKLLGGYSNTVLNDITVSIMEPQAMADKALSYVRDKGYRVLKVKVGADVNDDIRALTLIREAVGPDVRLRVDANQGYDVPTALKALNAFAALGVESVEQCLPAWNMEGAAYLRRKAPAIHLMLDESIHGPVDAARACRMDAADILNIKLMKCGGLYPAEQINAIAQANGLTCMVGCMMETKLSITAGLSFVAAKKNVMDADLDSFMEYVGGETHFPGGFTHKGSDFVLCDAPGFGLDIDF